MSTKKKNFLKRSAPASGEMSLNITAMADIFTVLLVFLLMGYSTGAMQITPSAGIQLPGAHAPQDHVEALKIEISADAVLIENQPVAKLAAFKVNANDRSADGTVKPLVEAIAVERKRQLLLVQGNADVKLDARVVVIADQKVPYATIKAVLASAAVQGYTDFKLAVQTQGS